jgi:hypothetical protein
MTSLALEALALSRAGDREGAIALLLAARENGPLDDPATSLLFSLLGDRGDDVDDHALKVELCERGLELATRPVQRSTWHLRRGLLWLERREASRALVDLQRVLALQASEDHLEQAREALLQVAALSPARPGRKTTRGERS